MVDRTSNANHFRSNQQTAFGVAALKPIVFLQVSWLRMWAASFERLARNYEKGLEETAKALKAESEGVPGQTLDNRPE